MMLCFKGSQHLAGAEKRAGKTDQDTDQGSVQFVEKHIGFRNVLHVVFVYKAI